MGNEISKLQKENENKVKELEKCLEIKDQYINQLKDQINNINKNIENIYDSFMFNNEEYFNFKKVIDSNILRYNELCLIEDGIKTKFNKKVKKNELLFRASRDGYKAETFHEKCDLKGYTITFVLTSINRRFGGFTDVSWAQNSSYKSGSNGFIFSLDNKEIYYNKNASYNIYCNKGYGPTFGSGYDFQISDNCNKNNESSDDSNNSYETNGKKYALAGSNYFIVKDYEVYKIDLE